jgi:hypothetical protein
MPDSPPPQPRNQVWVLYALLVLFGAPFALAWWMFNFTQLGRDGGASRHGDLIQPLRVVPDQTLFDPLAGSRYRHLYGKWNLVYLTRGGCDSRCEQRLYMMRQIWTAMGRDSPRLQRVVMVVDTKNKPAAADWPRQYPGQLVVLINPDDSKTMTGIFTLEAGDRPLDAGRLYLIDPLGNLMMSYPSGTDPVGIIKDLSRLLKYSGIG